MHKGKFLLDWPGWAAPSLLMSFKVLSFQPRSTQSAWIPSSLLYLASTSENTLVTSSGFDTSTSIETALRFDCFLSWTVSRAVSPFWSTTTTTDFSVPYLRAVIFPIPLPAPVTRIIRSTIENTIDATFKIALILEIRGQETHSLAKWHSRPFYLYIKKP